MLITITTFLILTSQIISQHTLVLTIEDEVSLKEIAPQAISKISWNPEYESIALVGTDTIYLYNVSTKELKRLFIGAQILDFEWSPSGEYLAIRTRHAVLIYSLSGSKISEITPNTLFDIILYSSWAPSKDLLAIAYTAKSLNSSILSVVTPQGKVVTEVLINGTVSSLSWSSKGNIAVATYRFIPKVGGLTLKGELHILSHNLSILSGVELGDCLVKDVEWGTDELIALNMLCNLSLNFLTRTELWIIKPCGDKVFKYVLPYGGHLSISEPPKRYVEWSRSGKAVIFYKGFRGNYLLIVTSLNDGVITKELGGYGIQAIRKGYIVSDAAWSPREDIIALGIVRREDKGLRSTLRLVHSNLSEIAESKLIDGYLTLLTWSSRGDRIATLIEGKDSCKLLIFSMTRLTEKDKGIHWEVSTEALVIITLAVVVLMLITYLIFLRRSRK